MAITVNTNVASMNAQRNLTNSQNSLNTSLQRISSGLRVNSAKDDAAGLAIAERMNAQVRGLTVGIRNANDGISLAQTAEGALASVTESLQRMRELAVQSANATNSTTDRTSLDAEYQALADEIGRVVASADFNGTKVFSSGGSGAQIFQIGANNTDDDRISVTTTDMVNNTTLASATGAGISAASVSAGVANAQSAIGFVDAALNVINSERATLGAAQSRMETAIRSLDTTRENTAAARGRIIDADFAMETANLTRSQILQQAGIAMLSQANTLPQSALALLQ